MKIGSYSNECIYTCIHKPTNTEDPYIPFTMGF